MNKKLIIGSALLTVLFGVIIWWGSKQPPTGSAHSQAQVESSAKSALTSSETLYDFGSISMKNGNVEKVFKITNPTNQDISIKSVVTSCMCTTAYFQTGKGEMMGPFGMAGHGGGSIDIDEIIKAGETRDLKVAFDPNAHGPAGVGDIDRFVTLAESSGASISVEVKAVVTP